MMNESTVNRAVSPITDDSEQARPFRPHPRNDFLSGEDVAAGLRWATVERNRGDSAAADRILRELYRSAVRTWGVGHRQLAPIEAAADRWNVRLVDDEGVSVDGAGTPGAHDGRPVEVMAGYLVVPVDGCTCDGGGEFPHRAGCGYEPAFPLAEVEAAIVRARRADGQPDASVSPVTDDMVQRGASAVVGSIFRREFEDSHNKHIDLARAVLSAGLAGYTPVPDSVPTGEADDGERWWWTR